FLTWNAGALAQEAWPQWRNQDFSSVGDADLPVEFNAEKNLLWFALLPGAGGASPVVAGDRVFVTTAVGKRKAALVCFSTDGKKLWQHDYELSGKMKADGSTIASPSPVTDGKHVWAMMATGELKCLTVDGDLVWSKNLQDEYGKFDIMFGYSSSPVLDNGKLYLMVIDGDMKAKPKLTSEGQVICLDAATGKEEWLHLRRTSGTVETMHSYASPTIYRDADRSLLLIHGADFLTAHDLDTGEEIWRCGGLNGAGDNYNPTFRFVASPAFSDGKIIVPSAKNGPMLCLKPDGKGDITEDKTVNIWRIEKGTPDVSTPVIHEGVIYLVEKKGIVKALDLADGKQLYRKRVLADKHRSTPVIAGDKLYIAGRDGTIAVLKTGTELEVLAENKLGQDTTASPAVANNILYIRTNKALYAFEEQAETE
ncbi:PQQ-binding-like beta-propeller repeat protein, partial [Mariniblastus sp.]|nr:PQQ-binding-like beta-propeller repeat protein [Mariniblastus sp.]